LFGQSELQTGIKQLEFTLFQLVQQIDDMFGQLKMRYAWPIVYKACETESFTEYFQKYNFVIARSL